MAQAFNANIFTAMLGGFDVKIFELADRFPNQWNASYTTNSLLERRNALSTKAFKTIGGKTGLPSCVVV